MPTNLPDTQFWFFRVTPDDHVITDHPFLALAELRGRIFVTNIKIVRDRVHLARLRLLIRVLERLRGLS